MRHAKYIKYLMTAWMVTALLVNSALLALIIYQVFFL